MPQLSVAENIFAGRQPTKWLGQVDVRLMRDKAKALIAQLGVEIDPARKVSALSPAQAQIVEIAKALSRDLRVLILDEPTAALTLTETEKLFEIVRRLAWDGVSIIYVSHRLAEIFALCHSVTVLKDGRLAGTRRVAETSTDELIRLMVGREVHLSRAGRPARSAWPFSKRKTSLLHRWSGRLRSPSGPARSSASPALSARAAANSARRSSARAPGAAARSASAARRSIRKVRGTASMPASAWCPKTGKHPACSSAWTSSTTSPRRFFPRFPPAPISPTSRPRRWRRTSSTSCASRRPAFTRSSANCRAATSRRCCWPNGWPWSRSC